jgi:acyl-CoA synthetase (AMP-forming)/AMP-acid ligase II
VDVRHRELGRLRTLLGGSVEIVGVDPADPFQGKPGEAAPSASLLAGTLPAADSLASIIYTSGTTGHPKGVMLSHGNLAANTESICGYLPIGSYDKALCVLPFPYSYGASVLHTHLVKGATLLLEDSLLYPHRILERMVVEGATSLAGVPSTFYLFLHRTDLSEFDLGSVRYVTQAGARMDPTHIGEFRSLVPSADFFVMYGQTEATARLAYVPAGQLDSKPGAAGKAIPGVELRVVDEGGNPLSSGQIGEVCAKGDNVMMGYWDDPLESEKVLRGGWLRTGDMGHLDDDGFLFLSGRSREMIKSGAHRIAPAEIEEVIRRVPGVSDVAVTGVDDEVLGEAVKAWVIARAPSERMKREIRRACQVELARFKVPKVVEFRDEFPRTSSGKVRKHQL